MAERPSESVEHAGACRYCGIEPGQAFPRPSYYEMRLRLESTESLLRDIVVAANGILHTYRRWAEKGAVKDAERLDEWTDLLTRAAVASPHSGRHSAESS